MLGRDIFAGTQDSGFKNRMHGNHGPVDLTHMIIDLSSVTNSSPQSRLLRSVVTTNVLDLALKFVNPLYDLEIGIPTYQQRVNLFRFLGLQTTSSQRLIYANGKLGDAVSIMSNTDKRSDHDAVILFQKLNRKHPEPLKDILKKYYSNPTLKQDRSKLYERVIGGKKEENKLMLAALLTFAGVTLVVKGVASKNTRNQTIRTAPKIIWNSTKDLIKSGIETTRKISKYARKGIQAVGKWVKNLFSKVKFKTKSRKKEKTKAKPKQKPKSKAKAKPKAKSKAKPKAKPKARPKVKVKVKPRPKVRPKTKKKSRKKRR
jgi:hypothetical protein